MNTICQCCNQPVPFGEHCPRCERPFPTEQATEGGVTTERDVRCHVAAPAQGETPRTDAALIEKLTCSEGGDHECTVYPAEEIVDADFARQLERELNEAKAELADLRNAGGPPFIRSEAIRNCREEIAALRQQLAQVTKERDAARDFKEQLYIRLRERRRVFFGDAEGLYVPESLLTAAESELAELRLDRERLAEIRTLIDAYERDYLNPRQLAFGGILLPSIVKIIRPDAARNQQEKKE